MTDQSRSPSPFAMAVSKRSRYTFRLGSGTLADSAAASMRFVSYKPRAVVNPAVAYASFAIMLPYTLYAGELNRPSVMTSKNAAGSTPYLRVSANPSPIASTAQPSTMLFASFTAAAPSGLTPQSNVRRPISANSGRTFATASFGPPATMLTVPAATPSGRPSTGAEVTTWPASV